MTEVIGARDSAASQHLSDGFSTGLYTEFVHKQPLAPLRALQHRYPPVQRSGRHPNPTFHVAPNLASATLTATVPVDDALTGQTSTFQVNLSWKADGKPEFLKNEETFADPELGIRIKSTSRSTQVEATATGTVFGIGQNYAADASDTATIQKQNDGTHTVQKTP